MNKAFKVLWNDVRRNYIVSSEASATRGKPAKSAKTLVCAAVTGALVLGMSATGAAQIDVTNDYVIQEEGTTKFISGNGNTLNIQTEGDARYLLEGILKQDWNQVQDALGTGKGVTLVGTVGGQNNIDSMTVTLLRPVSNWKPAVKPLLDRIEAWFGTVDETQTVEGSTNIVVGGETTPLILATVGADRMVNFLAASERGSELVRNGSSKVVLNSGNSILLTGASSAINIGDSIKINVGNYGVTPHGQYSGVILNGDVNIELSKRATTLGTIVGGSAVAIGGKASSIVNGTTHLAIETVSTGAGFEGLTVGVIGGGLAVGALGGESQTLVSNDSTIDVNSGLATGLFGGGVALAGDLDKETGSILGVINQALVNKGVELSVDADKVKGLGGKAQAESQNIAINLGSKSSSAFVIGGGLAGAYQYDGDTKASTATSKANNVTITVGEEGAGDVFANTDAKGKYFSDVKTALSNIKNKVGSSISLTDVMKALQGKNLSALKDALGKLDTAGLEKDVQTLIDALAETSGVNVGIFGGGVAAAWSRNEVYPGKVVDENNTGEGKYDVDAVTAPKATATVENVAINVLSGYNVGVFGGGIALASGDATVPEDGEKPAGTLAQSDVQTVTLNFAGGETIGVMGGGIAYAGGTGDMNYGLGAVSKVGTVNINVIGGSVDGIIGGGYAVDDTNPLKNGAPDTSKTASSTVDEVNITATSGKIGRLAFDAFFGQNQMPPIDTSKPDLRNYLDSMTYAMIQGKTAIVGGGISSGNRDESNETGAAHVNKVFIAIGGTTVVGLKEKEGYKANIYGGGIATEGGLATVDSATILVTDKAQIYGDIYGGGLALQGEYNNADYYNNAEAKVGTSKIVIAGGTVHGDIYAGGKVVAATNHQGEVIAKSTVDEGYVTLADPAVFEGTKIDANGVTTAALTLAGGEYDFKTNQSVNAFSKVRAQAVKNFTFDFGDKTETNWTGLYDVIGITANASADTSTVELRSGAVATKTGYNNVTFNVTGGVLALGDKATAQTAFDSVSAMNGIPGLYLAGAVDLSNVAANIGDANTATTGSVVLGSGATLTADAGAKTSVKEGTISGLNIGNLYFTNVATEGASVMFGDALVGVDLTDLSAATLDNVRYVASYNGTSQTVTFVQNEDGIALASLGLDGFDGKALDQIEKQTDEASELIKNYLDGQNKKLRNGDHRHAQLNAAFNLAAAGGVQTAGIEGAMIGLDQVAKRASLTNTFNDGVTGFAEVTGTQVQMGGSRSMLETKTQLGGLAFGGEYTQGDWTIGALANVGTGEVKGHGDNGGVKNDVDYYGLQAYAARRIGDFNIVGQAGWMTTSNDIVHGSGDSADVDADVWTVGARGEMNLKFSDELSFVPYVGVNYLRVSTDGYTTKKGFKVEDTDQNLVNMPIGVAVSGTKSFDSGWIVKSVFDVGYVHMFGDTNVEADTLVGQARMGTDLDVWSENVGRARLGFEAQKDAMALGFGLGMAAGSDDYREVYGQVNVKYVF